MKLAHIIFVVAALLTVVACQNKKIDTAPTAGLNSIYFDFDQSFIRSDAVPTMQGNAGHMKANASKAFAIEGSCDNRGTNEYNLALGHRRAESAKNYLTNLGVGADKVRTVSYGEEKPVCFTSDEGCWQRNRRADFKD